MPYTITLTFASIGLAVAIGLPLGAYAATHPNSLLDRIAALISVAFIAINTSALAANVDVGSYVVDGHQF